MLVACLLASLLYVTGQCENMLASLNYDENHKVIECVIDIIDKYFSERKGLTFVNLNPDDDALLKAIHSNINITLISRQATQQMFIPNRGYLISSANVVLFTKYFKYLIKESMWNPYARFLIIITFIQDIELKLIFDELLKHHVINVLVVNGTDDGDLYTYNPFDNYACGKYYDSFISYGMCSQPTKDLYPEKLVTGLKKCNFTASIAHRPPFTVNPLKIEGVKTLLGFEEQIITILGEVEEFTVNFIYNYNGDLFSMVAPNMTAIGPMLMLQKNECDVIFGGMMMVTSRAEAFTYLCGYHDYIDQLQFVVRISSLIPPWKYIYLEFDLNVWALLFITFVLFSVIINVLLQAKDKGELVLRLLDNLLVHGRDIRTRLTIKCLLITWIWFAYLINTFYQSSLVSFTTHPGMEYQVSDEDDIIKYNFQPCFSNALRDYLSTETSKLGKFKYFREEGCQTTGEAMDTVSTTNNLFTLMPNYYYFYNHQKYHDKWGNSMVYFFPKPYAKFLYGYFFYKGFPITNRLQLNALRMRESGLAYKSLQDNYYGQILKQKFHNQSFVTRFILPWSIIALGFTISTVAFIIEVLFKYIKLFKCKSLVTVNN